MNEVLSQKKKKKKKRPGARDSGAAMESALPRWWLVFLSPGRTGTGRDDPSTENGGSVSLFPRALTDSGWPVCELAVVAHVSVVIKQVFCLVVGRFSPQTLY